MYSACCLHVRAERRDHWIQELECVLPSPPPGTSVQLAEVDPSEGPRLSHPRNKGPSILPLTQCKDWDEEGHWDLGSTSVQVWLLVSIASCPSPHLHMITVTGPPASPSPRGFSASLTQSRFRLLPLQKLDVAPMSVPSIQDHVCTLAKPHLTRGCSLESYTAKPHQMSPRAFSQPRLWL